MRTITGILILITAGSIFQSCLEEEGACLLNVVNGIEVTPVNEFGNPVSDSVTAVIIDGSYIDTLRTFHSNTGELLYPMMYGATERPGNYTLLITSDYFETYLESNIIVSSTSCHVITETINVQLKRK